MRLDSALPLLKILGKLKMVREEHGTGRERVLGKVLVSSLP